MRVSKMFSNSVAGLILAISLAGCGASPQNVPQLPRGCSALTETADQVWNAEVRKELNIPVKIIERVFEASQAEQIINQLNQFTTQWMTLYQATCDAPSEDQPDAPASTEVPLSAECLKTTLEQQRQIVTAIRQNASSGIEAQVGRMQTDLDGCGTR